MGAFQLGTGVLRTYDTMIPSAVCRKESRRYPLPKIVSSDIDVPYLPNYYRLLSFTNIEVERVVLAKDPVGNSSDKSL